MPAALRRSLVALLFLTAPLVLAAATFGLPSAADDSAEAAATSDAAASSDATPTSAPAGTALDLTGKWLLRHTVLRSDRASYRGLVLLFQVQLVQVGTRVTGTATKWRENGRAVPPGARSRLEIEGTLEGDEIVGRFVETVGRRTQRGSFRWRYSVEAGWLMGTFKTNVASASGDATAIAIG